MPHDSPLSGGYTPGSVEGSMKLKELTDLCTKLVARVTSLETKLKKTKEVHGKALTKLVKKVKRLEDELKSTNKRKKAKMVIPDEEELVSEDPSKQGRMEETEYADVKEENAGVEYDFDLTEQQVTPLKAPQVKVQSQETFEAELRVLSLVSTAEDIQDTDEEKTKALEQQEQERANLEAALKLQKIDRGYTMETTKMNYTVRRGQVERRYEIARDLSRKSKKPTDHEDKVFGGRNHISKTKCFKFNKLDDLKINHKFRGGLLGIKGLLQVSTAQRT
ncbi:hypothetical protein Tco_0708302 [Tanacetum coccineum]